MAIDQRNISSKLRFMDDRTLQKYAAMHKNDPYIFPLAFQENQNRKALEANKAAQMGGQEMPKVNDAALMAMAPQAAPQMAQPMPQGQGISNLPAPNMQRMADGGIAGYEDDEEGMATGGMGGMFNFAQQSEPVVRMSGGGVPRYQGMPIDIGGDGSVVDEFAGVDDQIIANMERQKMLGAFDDYSAYTPKPKKGSKAAKKLEEEEAKSRSFASKEAKKEEPAKPKVELPALQTYTPQTAEEARAASDKMAEPSLAEIQKSYKPFAEQFAQDRSRIEGREKNNLSDALIRGGLKALGGKSQYAMQNISEGGLEGLNAYQEGIKYNDAARKALTQSEMLMTQAQRAEERGARAEAAGFYVQADKSKQMGVQLSNTARQIMSTEEFQRGQTEVSLRNAATAEQNALTSGRMADASMVTARAAEARAKALNAVDKSALTPKDIAKFRDTAIDNVNKNYETKLVQAQTAAGKSGKKFDEKTWYNEQVTNEFNRLIQGLQTGKGVGIMSETPTGGDIGSGTIDLTKWGQHKIVTPK
jgi:hypothetical protein